MTSLFSMFIEKHLKQYVHPVVYAENNKLAFFEVLSRVDYDGKIFAPKDFLHDITNSQRYKMAELVILRISQLQKKYPHISFSVNLSSIEFKDGFEKLLSKLAESAESSLDPKRTIIELVETSIISESTMKKIKELKEAHGYRFAIDDFGAGYSTIKQISKSNGIFEMVKVDGSLIEDIEYDKNKKHTLELFVNIIKIHNKKVVLEFVRTPENAKLCKNMGADYLQGFVFGKPAEIEKYIERMGSEMIIPFCEKIYDIEHLLPPSCRVNGYYENCENKKKCIYGDEY
jgi:EAL domain-containing protein (putative c-di-GMP-specific phosphodiesterase class I)